MALNYRVKDTRIYSNRRIKALSDLQYRIWDYAMCGDKACNHKGVGIYHVSTSDFKFCDIELIHEQLGRTNKEVSLFLYNTETKILSEEEEKLKIGKMIKDFSDLIEYDPDNDMIYSKLSFEYSTKHFLTTHRAIVEGVHSDFKAYKPMTCDRWWGEFAIMNSVILHESFEEFKKSNISSKNDEKSSGHKNFKAIQKTFETLFDLEKKYKISPSVRISVENMEKFINNFQIQI